MPEFEFNRGTHGTPESKLPELATEEDAALRMLRAAPYSDREFSRDECSLDQNILNALRRKGFLRRTTVKGIAFYSLVDENEVPRVMPKAAKKNVEKNTAQRKQSQNKKESLTTMERYLIELEPYIISNFAGGTFSTLDIPLAPESKLSIKNSYNEAALWKLLHKGLLVEIGRIPGRNTYYTTFKIKN